MPRVNFVKKARKDNPAVKAGESYYWWKFRYGGKRYSATRPRPSQLTQSAYFGPLYEIQEMIEDWRGEPEDWESLLEEVEDELNALCDEQQEKIDNMAEYGLEYSPTGEMVQERLDALEAAIDEVNMVDEFEFDEEDFDEDEPTEGDYDSEDDYEEEYADWEARRDDHEANEEFRKEQEFNEWADTARDKLIEIVGNAIV